MCLAIPSKIVSMENEIGTIDVAGVTRQASLLLLEDPRVGDYVIVHAGFAIHKIDETTARESLEIIHEIAARMDGEEAEE